MEQPHHLADALSALLAAHDKSGREVAASVGISHSILSRLRGQRIDISSLQKLVAWFKEPVDRERLIMAHLWDELSRIGVDPSVFWNSLGDEDTRWYQSLPLKVQASLRALGDSAANDASFADLLDGMAERRLRSAVSVLDPVKYPESGDSALAAAETAPGKSKPKVEYSRPKKAKRPYDPVKESLAAELRRRRLRSLQSAPHSSPSAPRKEG